MFCQGVFTTSVLKVSVQFEKKGLKICFPKSLYVNVNTMFTVIVSNKFLGLKDCNPSIDSSSHADCYLLLY